MQKTADIHAANLTAPEIEVLKAGGKNGVILVVGGASGRKVQDVDNDDPASQAIYVDCIDSLQSKGLLRMESKNVYRLTGRGFEIRKAWGIAQ
jgi:hypothetical protein